MSGLIPRRIALFTALMTVLSLGLVAVGPAQAAPRTAESAVAEVNETVTGVGGLPATLVGEFTATRFVRDGNVLSAVGTFTGTLGGVPVTDDAVTAEVRLQQSTGSCEILDLVLGPLNLDLLGLVITLDTVHLNITAEQGPGNLLGNLLCAIAGLLDGPTGLNTIVGQITRLLNQLLGALG
jgi:hypothetical protein